MLNFSMHSVFKPVTDYIYTFIPLHYLQYPGTAGMFYGFNRASDGCVAESETGGHRKIEKEYAMGGHLCFSRPFS